MKETTSTEKSYAKAYDQTEPKQFGNLHERMQYLMACAKAHGEQTVPSDMWNAIWDLQTEVKHYKPVNPPFGHHVGYKSSGVK